MGTTRHHTTLLATVLLAGTVGLGACGQAAPDAPPAPQAAGAEPAPQGDTLGTTDLTAEQLRALRELYPTAGLEVPPADLTRTGSEHPLTEPADRFTRHAQ